MLQLRIGGYTTCVVARIQFDFSDRTKIDTSSARCSFLHALHQALLVDFHGHLRIL